MQQLCSLTPQLIGLTALRCDPVEQAAWSIHSAEGTRADMAYCGYPLRVFQITDSLLNVDVGSMKFARRRFQSLYCPIVHPKFSIPNRIDHVTEARRAFSFMGLRHYGN